MDGYEAVNNCQFWTISENWGNLSLVDPKLIYLTHDYRLYLNKALNISPVEGAVYAVNGHHDQSWHKIIKGRNSLAMAMDVFPSCDIAFAWITALRFPFGGIGIYPYAQYGKLKGMLHLDIRPTVTKVLWYRDEAFKYHYLHDPDEVFDLCGILAR